MIRTKYLSCALFLLVGCTPTPQKKVHKNIKIGTDATYPPFEYIDTKTSEIVGFDIDLIKEICTRMGYKAEFVVVPFDGIIAGLQSKKYDMIISAMTITEERSKEVSFSQPYYLSGQSIVVTADNTTINSEKDLSGKIIGVQLGTTGEMLAKKIPQAKIISYDNITAAFIDLDNRRLDAIVNDIPTNKIIVSQRKGLKIVSGLLTKEYYGIAVRKNDKELLDKINFTLMECKKDNYLTKLYKKWSIE